MVNSARFSVCHTFFTVFASSYHCEILGVITNDQSEVHAKGQGQRSKVKVAEVKTQLNPFWTVTPVSIHIWWWWNDAQSLVLLRRYALLFFKVIHQILRSHETKTSILTQIGRFRTVIQSEFTDGYEMMHKAWSDIEEVSYCFSRSCVKLQGHTGQNKSPILTRIERFRTVT